MSNHNGKHLFDIAFALRLCNQNEKNRACIYIYSAMGLYQDAVEKALQVDVKIAKEMAGMPEDDETRKKLWNLSPITQSMREERLKMR
ncbi:hypothetical protein PsorP6_001171 [Peronosclerospora sorghi]|uniref:Uncharacterized protein n=1 Tax=Peronosclerospora sorghi TaxID=230839 RepID=A0ACC0WX65_9STRA|nr:hypothetical protein PsorP6_001171 [Peronosclerospora sorghi]